MELSYNIEPRKARAYLARIRKFYDLGFTDEEIAEKDHCSVKTIRSRVALCNLCLFYASPVISHKKAASLAKDYLQLHRGISSDDLVCRWLGMSKNGGYVAWVIDTYTTNLYEVRIPRQGSISAAEYALKSYICDGDEGTNVEMSTACLRDLDSTRGLEGFD